ncbi:MAG: CHASE2 domain-containing protein [Verrucomicrobiota bacterium]
MSQPDKTSRIAVLLFTDMVDSVGKQLRLGGEAYTRLLQLHDQIFRDVLQRTGDGVIRNNTGDGFLVEFRTAANAVNAALLFQFLLHQTKWVDEPIQVRIGLHQGHVSELPGDTISARRIMGMTVNIAARVMGLAGAKQILLTRPVYDDARQFVRQHPAEDVSPRPALEWEEHGEFLLQGVNSPVEIFEVGVPGFAPLFRPAKSDEAQSADEPPTSLPPPSLSKWRPVIGAILATLVGLALWQMPVAEGWINASYDYLFRFGARPVTNEVTIIRMDDASYAKLHQTRTNRWDRALHVELLNHLARDGCPLVVFDVFFDEKDDADKDAALAEAMRQQGGTVLAAKVGAPKSPNSEALEVQLPLSLFLDATTNWGIAKVKGGLGDTIRQHWPFPAPQGDFLSLPWKAAQATGIVLEDQPGEQWMRYYRERGGWEEISYYLALQETNGYFRNKIVFIGNDPATKNDPNYPEKDKFRTPYTRWNGEAVGGVDILATEFLNLVNKEWLRRSTPGMEALVLLLTGLLLGGGLGWFRPLPGLSIGLGLGISISLASVALSYYTNLWYPWLIIVGGQIPCALVWGLFSRNLTQLHRGPTGTIILPRKKDELGFPPKIPDFELVFLFGKGSFGEVWLVRNAIDQWQALKIVYRHKFADKRPYDTEYEGIQRFKPVSEKHPGLLRTEFVSRKRKEGYFYYIMELGDAHLPGWENNPTTYQPRTLASVCAQTPENRLPLTDCLSICIALAEALEFLHQNGLTHRDIKPSNVIFVDNRPKLADVGLVTGVRVPGDTATRIGTPGYMPPLESEPQGTVAADIYALGMVLYVISTGSHPATCPSPPGGMNEVARKEFSQLQIIFETACHRDRPRRYESAAALRAALLEVQQSCARKSEPS